MQTLRLNILPGEPPSLHPHLNSGHLSCRCLGRLLFECLTRINAQGSPEPAGATSISVSPDETLYTFNLRKSLWSDGTPVTAFQYEKAWKAAMSQNSPCTRPEMFYVIKNAKEIKQGHLPLSAAGVKAVDEHTLIVELAFPCPFFLKALAEPIFAPIDEPKEKPTKFNGGYVVDRWDQGQQLLLKANPLFWNRKHIRLNAVEISFITDPNTTYRLFEEGKLDWVGMLFCSLPIETVTDLEQRHMLRTDDTLRVCWIHLNTGAPLLGSRSIRQALSLALDRDEIHRYILAGHPLYSPLPRGISSCTPSHEENLQQAQVLFAAGLKELGFTKETAPPLELRNFANARINLLAQYLQQVWQKAFDFPVRLVQSDWNTFRKALEKGDFQIGGCFETPLYQDPLAFLEIFDLPTLPNYTRWTNMGFHEKIALAKLATNAQQRTDYIREAEQILIQELPVIPISNDVDQYAHHPAFKGYVLDHSGHVDFSYAYFES